MKSQLFGLSLALLALTGCKTQSFERHTLRTHEGIGQPICADKGGYVQVNIDGCTVPNFPFYGSLSNATFYEYQTLRDGKQVRFDKKLAAGQCADVGIVNMDEGASVTCNFHIYWDL